MENEIQIRPIARFRSPFSSKFGIPRQSGIVEELTGRIVFRREFGREEAVRGLEGFDYLWIIWGFSGNAGRWGLTVRPPRLGGNRSVGVFASRSPFRPNGLGLSSVRILDIEPKAAEGLSIIVSGADLMDGTPIYDIKPYIKYSDSHPYANPGYVGEEDWHELDVDFPEELQHRFIEMRQDFGCLEEPQDAIVSGTYCSDKDRMDLHALTKVLKQGPVPRYVHDPDRIWGMTFMGCDIRFRISGGTLTVVGIIPAEEKKI